MNSQNCFSQNIPELLDVGNDDILAKLFFQMGFGPNSSFIICATNSEGEASVRYDLSMRGETGGGVLVTTVS